MADYLDQTQAMVRDPDGTIRFWSRGAEALYGWSRDEAVGRFSHDLLATEFPKPAVEIEAEVREHGSWIGELRQRRRDGSTIWVASHWAVHTHAHCAEVAVIEVNNDITPLKLAEAALLKSEATSPSLFENASQEILTIDAQGRIVTANLMLRGMFGITAGS